MMEYPDDDETMVYLQRTQAERAYASLVTYLVVAVLVMVSFATVQYCIVHMRKCLRRWLLPDEPVSRFIAYNIPASFHGEIYQYHITIVTEGQEDAV